MLKRMLVFLHKRWQIKRDPVGYARSIGVSVGERCRLINLSIGTFGSEPYLVQLGDHVTLTDNVRFITHDGGVWVFRQEHPDLDVFGPIRLGNNVFVGINTIIFPGVTIGDNCVIGAGSMVTRDIPPGSVAAGVPARVLKSVDDYRESVLRKALFVRSYSPQQKRDFLTKHFSRPDHPPA